MALIGPPHSGGGANLARADICRRHFPRTRSGGGPDWAPAFGGWPRLGCCGGHASAITCWRSLTGALGRTCAGDTFQGPVLDRPVPDRPVPGVALIGAPHPGGGPDWTLWRRTSSTTGGGSRAILAGGPIGVAAWGRPQPGRWWRPRLGNHMLALSDSRTRTDMCRRHVSGPRSRGGPHWGPAFGGWPRLGCCGDLALAITCWRSLTGALGRTSAG